MSNSEGSSLLGPRLKLERAEKHLNDLVAAIQGFFETNPYGGVIQDNPETGRREFRITRADPLPDSLTVISGDVVHNLRSALDHLIWQLVIANGGEPDGKTAFPIWRSKAKFISGRPGYAKEPAKRRSMSSMDSSLTREGTTPSGGFTSWTSWISIGCC